jgi:hypothetical protein
MNIICLVVMSTLFSLTRSCRSYFWEICNSGYKTHLRRRGLKHVITG